MKPKYRADIDGLRAVAILPVVLFHLGVASLSGGFVGVDIFFVISGFLITGILEREVAAGCFSIVSFYERRVRRIFPALFAVLLVTMLAGMIWLAPNNLQDLGKSAIAASLFGSNIFFWRSIDYFEVSAELRPLLHTWSLAVEEQFYLFFPPLLLLIYRWQRWKNMLLIGATIGSFAIAVYLGNSPAGFYLLPPRAFELGIGAILATTAIPPIKRQWIADAMGIVGLLLILAAVALIRPDMPFPGPWAIIPALGAGLIIHAGKDRLHFAGKILSTPVLQFFGLISYSAYIWHWPILVAARFWLAGPVTVDTQIILALIILAVSTASWRYIERPFRDPKQISRRTIFTLAVAAMTLVIVLGSVSWATQGLPSRFAYAPTPKRAGAESARLHQCFLDFSDSFDRWSRRACTMQANDPAARTILLWGDSFAAHYGPGIAALRSQGNPITLIQANFAACPPILGDAQRLDRRCFNFNQRVAASVRSAAPDVAILAASWSHDVEAFSGRNADLAALLSKTIAILKVAGVKHVILVGDSPRYFLDVEQLRMQSENGWALPRNDFSHEETLRSVALSQGATYVSPRDSLCAQGRCRILDDQHRLLQWDEAHFTYAGSAFMARRLFSEAIAASDR